MIEGEALLSMREFSWTVRTIIQGTNPYPVDDIFNYVVDISKL